MKLSVIIPAKNEESTIGKTIESVHSYLKSKDIEHEIIPVVNNSSDRTAQEVRDLKPHIHNLVLVDYHGHPGKGYAVRKGMLEATGDRRLFMDADNSTTIDNIEHMMPYFDKGYDVVVASIGVKGATVSSGSEPVWRRLFGKLGNLYIQILAVPGIHDTQRGFKIMTAQAAQDVFSVSRIDGWGFDVEMLALARKFGHKIKEVPIHWKNDGANTRVGLKAYIQVLKDTLQVRVGLMTGKYNHAKIKHHA